MENISKTLKLNAAVNKAPFWSCHIHPSKEINMTTPMNWVKRMSGVKNDHTGHSAMLKLHDAAIKAAVVRGGMAGYSWS